MEFNTHPAILITGAICTIILIFLVTIGLSCSAYKMGNTDFEAIYRFAESFNGCK